MDKGTSNSEGLETDEEVNQLSKNLATTLNVDAPVFVPSFALPSQTATSEAKQPATNPTPQTNSLNHENVKNDNDVVDDWEANADEEENEEDEVEEEGIPFRKYYIF